MMLRDSFHGINAVAIRKPFGDNDRELARVCGAHGILIATGGAKRNL
ncbi:MAG: hypothetical protein IT173_12725 [Acidobacteria bacterium]|nr:hypothetical protein [Acidobacteriota bacterium]